ncbi:uncharacterized protein GBIM_08669 [Gryllus bimaculatus]|nr:uncharacterized protein GBIM_08669 [Gryllus bimaculatus]
MERSVDENRSGVGEKRRDERRIQGRGRVRGGSPGARPFTPRRRRRASLPLPRRVASRSAAPRHALEDQGRGPAYKGLRAGAHARRLTSDPTAAAAADANAVAMVLRSFVDYPPDCDFPLENLPYGIFSTDDDRTPRPGVAIGARILDLKAVRHLLDGPLLRAHQDVFAQALLAAEGAPGADGRLREDTALRARALPLRAAATLHLPARVGDYTDFYASLHHATNTSPDPDAPPAFGPSRLLDFELEVGALIGGPPTPLGEPVPVARAHDHIFGLVLVNDWSARDIQKWEYQPLGPFTAKNFATTLSPWVVTLEALEPFLMANPEQQPQPLPYLRHQDPFNFDIDLRVALRPAEGGEPITVSSTNFSELYWTFKQMVAHHTVTGCNLNPGDLLASGTISGRLKFHVIFEENCCT